MQVTVSYNPFDKTELAALKKVSELDMNTLAQEVETMTAKRGKPAKTVSEDESEDFGKRALKKEDLHDDEECEALDEDESDDEDSDNEVPFSKVKAAINLYGEDHPDEMKAILLSFNFKSTKELEKQPKKYEAVYNKVMAQLKKLKKK